MEAILELGPDRSLTHDVHHGDPDRFWCLIPSAPASRPPVVALLALNQELGRVAEQVTQPMAGFIRLQWWREAIEEAAAGRPRRHPVAEALPTILGQGVSAVMLEELVDAREREVDDTPFQTLGDLVGHARATAGRLQEAVAQATGGDPARAGQIGTAYGLIGIIRSTGHLATCSRSFLPVELLQKHGVRRDDALAGKMSDGLREAVREVMDAATGAMAGLRPKRGEAATPLLLISRYQARAIGKARYDPFAAAAVERPPLLALRLLVLQATGL